ncbi:sugar transporter [Vibrio rotiferianus]|uniref:Sugar transporter n=1 Tax=Vibrio rotiferianus TaxID=190895 RepID=A0ABX3DCQ1_9VIBR|nr:sugar transporter [Vibrio rotiferianus]OHY95424.1 sugar transporter [Vibrio rotiferianus]
MSDHQFSISAICQEAIVMVRANLLTIIIACIPLIVVHTIFITQYQEALVQGSQEPDFSSFGVGFFITTFLLYPLVAAMAAVRIHRIYLACEYMRSALDVMRLSMRELRFIGWWILFALAMGLIIALPIFLVTFFIIVDGGEISSLALEVITLVLSVPGYWVLSRWSLVLPATALDREPRSLGDAWRQSRPFNKQIFVLMGLIPLLVGTLSQLVFAEFSHLLAMIVSGVIFGLFGAYQIALLSLSYRTIVDIERSRFKEVPDPQQDSDEFPA